MLKAAKTQTTNRDDFPQKVINLAKLRAAYICSNPTCRILTIAPSPTDEMLVQYNGEIAHITAAAVGGPRYDPNISEEERKSISNAIFLCSNCADLTDKNNGIDYKTKTILKWKEEHEKWVLENLNKSVKGNHNISTNSYLQSGGITANIVNINTISSEIIDQNKKHDTETFLKSEEVISEDQIHKLYNNLISYADCRINDSKRLESIYNFFIKAGNSFINPIIEKNKKEFIEKIHPLSNFMSYKFDKWPYNQDSDNFKIQLKPDYLRDTQYKNVTPKQRQEWDLLFEELKIMLEDLYNSYNIFRLSITHELHI